MKMTAKNLAASRINGSGGPRTLGNVSYGADREHMKSADG